MTDYQKAIDQRSSRRTYLNKPLTYEHQLSANIETYNAQSGLQIRLVQDDPWVFAGFSASYGMFSGVRDYFAIIGDTEDPRLNVLAGYWGEYLVLDATLMDLGTCWVGGTYKKAGCRDRLALGEAETLVCVIPVGVVPPEKTLKEKVIYRMAKRSGKPADEFYTVAGEAPPQFYEGIEAVRKAPSALNRQPVYFSYDDGLVTACVPDKSTYEGIDLGIAMLHFEIGSGTANRFEEVDGIYLLRL